MIQSEGWHATSLHNTFCDWHRWHVEKVGPSVLWNSCTVTYGRLIVLSLVKGNRRGMFALYQKGVGCSGRVSMQTGHRSLSLRVTWFLLPFHSKSACMLRTILKLLRLSKDSVLNIKKKCNSYPSSTECQSGVPLSCSESLQHVCWSADIQ